jgi:hypothetical protein
MCHSGVVLAPVTAEGWVRSPSGAVRLFMNIPRVPVFSYTKTIFWGIHVFSYAIYNAKISIPCISLILKRSRMSKSPFTLRNRVLQGFFTNTYNKSYPIGFFTAWRFFWKTFRGCEKPYWVGFVVGENLLKNPYFKECSLCKSVRTQDAMKCKIKRNKCNKHVIAIHRSTKAAGPCCLWIYWAPSRPHANQNPISTRGSKSPLLKCAKNLKLYQSILIKH